MTMRAAAPWALNGHDTQPDPPRGHGVERNKLRYIEYRSKIKEAYDNKSYVNKL